MAVFHLQRRLSKQQRNAVRRRTGRRQRAARSRGPLHVLGPSGGISSISTEAAQLLSDTCKQVNALRLPRLLESPRNGPTALLAA